MNSDGLKLSSTSALVLLWAGRNHLCGQRAHRYLDALDLTEGRALFAACNKLCPYYAEVIHNRKYAVRLLIANALQQTPSAQLVIAGAGLDPLGIDLAESYPHTPIYEIDRANMAAKNQRYLATLDHPSGHHPLFITADLEQAHYLQQTLQGHGWNPSLPTLLILEGVSYYLPSSSLRALTAALQPTWLVCEYLKPETCIAPDRAAIPRQVFDLIARECALPAIQRYTVSTLQQLLPAMQQVKCYDLSTLENMRTRTNRYFPTSASGWIEVSLLRRSIQNGDCT